MQATAAWRPLGPLEHNTNHTSGKTDSKAARADFGLRARCSQLVIPSVRNSPVLRSTAIRTFYPPGMPAIQTSGISRSCVRGFRLGCITASPVCDRYLGHGVSNTCDPVHFQNPTQLRRGRIVTICHSMTLPSSIRPRYLVMPRMSVSHRRLCYLSAWPVRDQQKFPRRDQMTVCDVFGRRKRAKSTRPEMETGCCGA